jgi:hypothetical protein
LLHFETLALIPYSPAKLREEPKLRGEVRAAKAEEEEEEEEPML